MHKIRMKIIISPAKKIKKEAELLFEPTVPVFLEQAKKLSSHLKTCSYLELKKLLNCNDEIATLDYSRYQNMDFSHNIYHALLAYDGIQYKYMAPLVFDTACFDYVSKHVRIISGLYGLLHPLDGIQPYRLEMQTKLKTDFCKDLYDFWGSKIYDELEKDETLIVNLASKEYSKCIEKYCTEQMRLVTCSFLDVQQDTGKLVEKGVYVKMARGEMVRYMAEHNVTTVAGLKEFSGLGYVYNEAMSEKNIVVFTR